MRGKHWDTACRSSRSDNTSAVRLLSIKFAALLLAAGLLCAFSSRPVDAATGMELLSGVGYKSTAGGPAFLLGAELTSYSRQGSFFTGLQETRASLHLSDVFSLDQSASTLTAGLEGEWARMQGPFSLSLEGLLFFRQRGTEWARTATVAGSGTTGRIRGTFRVDYIESALATFPWFQKDLEGVSQSEGDQPFYRIHAGVSAAVLPQYNLNWSQDVRWRRPVGSAEGTVGVTTGPEIKLGAGMLAAQGGILFSVEGIEPLGQVRYQVKSPHNRVEFQLTAATLSLDGNGPVLYGWFGLDGETLGLGAALRLEQQAGGELNPAIYFSIHPKF